MPKDALHNSGAKGGARQKSYEKLIVKVTYCPTPDAIERIAKIIRLLLCQHGKLMSEKDNPGTKPSPDNQENK